MADGVDEAAESVSSASLDCSSAELLSKNAIKRVMMKKKKKEEENRLKEEEKLKMVKTNAAPTSSSGKIQNWSGNMNMFFLGLLKEEYVAGNFPNRQFVDEVWDRCTRKINEAFNVSYTKENLKHRWRTLKKTYRIYRRVLVRSGWSWDSKNCVLFAADELLWHEIKEINMEWYKLKGKVFPYFDHIDYIYGEQFANGRFVVFSNGGLYPRAESSGSSADGDLPSNEICDYNTQRSLSRVQENSPNGFQQSVSIPPSTVLMSEGSCNDSGKRKSNNDTPRSRRKRMTYLTDIFQKLVETNAKLIETISRKNDIAEALLRQTRNPMKEAMTKVYSIPYLSNIEKIELGKILMDPTERTLFLSFNEDMMHTWIDMRLHSSNYREVGGPSNMPHTYMP